MAGKRFEAVMTGRARKIAVGLFGGLVTTAGLVLLAFPGPGLLVLLLGLTILAGEFMWARRLKRRVERESHHAREALRRRRMRRERDAQRRRARQGPRVDRGGSEDEQQRPAVT